jgi:hypothetical protein
VYGELISESWDLRKACAREQCGNETTVDWEELGFKVHRCCAVAETEETVKGREKESVLFDELSVA